MRQQLIMFLIRTQLKLKKYERFRFYNQKSKIDIYYFTDRAVMKICDDGIHRESSVSLNWLIGNRCIIEKVYETDN